MNKNDSNPFVQANKMIKKEEKLQDIIYLKIQEKLDASTHQELSEKLAGLLGIKPNSEVVVDECMNGCDTCCGYEPVYESLWLTQDSARMFELMVEHTVDIVYYSYGVVAELNLLEPFPRYQICENWDNHTDEAEATCIAIAKAIIAKEEK